VKTQRDRVAKYEFFNEDGELLFWKNRYALPNGGKTFGYRWREAGRTHVHWCKPEMEPRNACYQCGRYVPAPFWADDYLYRLPQVLRAVERGRSVWWCEGEKDAETVAAQGKVSTSHHGGAGKVYPEMADWLEGTRVYVVLDNDIPGYYDAWLRRQVLKAVGAQVAFRAPVHPYKDVTDHIQAGWKLSDMRTVLASEVREKALLFNENTAGGYAHLVGLRG
jgi:hypothetical protein